MKIKKIFIDLDGTILDCSERHYKCHCYILNKLGYSLKLSKKKYWNEKRLGKSESVILKQFYNLKSNRIYLNIWRKDIESDQLLKLDRLISKMKFIMNEWKNEKKKIYLVTKRTNKKMLLSQLEIFDLFKFFEIIFVDNCLKSLNKTDQVKKKIKNFNYSVWIGDTEADYFSANILNIPILLVEWGQRNRSFLLKKKNSKIVKSPIDLLNLVK